MTTLSQRSFAGGELAPVLYARCDTVKHQTGLRTMRNFFTKKSGGAENRPGSQFVTEIKDSTQPIRLVKFVFDNEQSYVLEFGNQYIRFIDNGVYINTGGTPGVITAITKANPGVVTSAGHGLTNGQQIILSGIVGMTQLDNRTFIVAGVTTNTFTLKYLDGTAVDTTGFTTYVSGGQIDLPLEVVTPYQTVDLPLLKYVQSADVITITHPSYAPRELQRTDLQIWNLVDVSSPTPDSPTPAFFSVNSPMNLVAVSTDKVFYVVTGVDAQTLEESLHSAACSSPNEGTSTTPNNMISVHPATGVSTYNFYKSYSINGPFGLVNRSAFNGYKDFGDTPDYTQQPPNWVALFNSTDNYPSCVAYAQQRLLYGKTNNNPEKVWGSKIGFFHNFTTRFPLQDDDSLSWVSAGRQVNIIKHMLELNNLIIFTEGGEFVIEGGNLGQLTPTTLNPRQNSYNGASDLAPIVIDNNAVYVQALGSIVRDLTFDWQIDGYHGNDITTFSAHLFEGHTLADWDYQKIPDSLIWAARDDGVLLCCTYVREQQILAWNHHDFQNGFVENVCCIPEGQITAVYLTVRRVVNGRTVRYIERLTPRFVNDVVDSVFMDASLSFDGRNATSPFGSKTIVFSSPTGWTENDTQTATASAPFFASTNVGDQLQFFDPVTGDQVRFTITAYTSTTVVTVQPVKNVSTALQALLLAGTTNWNFAVLTLQGLWHLEGQTVSVLGDGFVVASPNNPEVKTVITVTNGQITLPIPHAVVHVGLPIVADLETLDIDTPNGETLVGKKMFVGRVYMQVSKTRGLFVGPKQPPVASMGQPALDPLANLYEFKIREYEGYSSPINLQTGQEYIAIDGQWNSNGRVFVRQVDPLPAAILAIMADGHMPIRQMGT